MYRDGKTVYFKPNKIVKTLLDAGPFKLSQLAALEFSQEDWEQFYQLIGYSVNGYGELSRVSDRSKNEADHRASWTKEGEENPRFEEATFSQMQQLWDIVECWRDKYQPTSAESIHQMDSIQEGLYVLVREVLEVVGYWRDPAEVTATEVPQFSDMKCPDCGSARVVGAHNCWKCGKDLRAYDQIDSDCG